MIDSSSLNKPLLLPLLVLLGYDDYVYSLENEKQKSTHGRIVLFVHGMCTHKYIDII